MMRRATLTVGLHVLVATGSLLLTGTAQATPIQPTYSANAFGFGCPFTQNNSPTLSDTFTGVTPSGNVSVATQCDYNNGFQIVPDGASYAASAFASATSIGAKATATANVFSTSNASDNTIVLAALEPGSLNGQGVDKLGKHYASTNGWSLHSTWHLEVNANVGSDSREQVPTLASIGFTAGSIYYPNADLTAERSAQGSRTPTSSATARIRAVSAPRGGFRRLPLKPLGTRVWVAA